MIGVDIGGANLKVVDRLGRVHIHYCPLWKEAPIAEILREYAGDRAAVVMSGELADCFADKMEGIAFIVHQVNEVFPDALFYGTDGQFHDRPVKELGAANWLASADHLRSRYPDALLVDMGSTTTDIIPLGPFHLMKGQTDLTRLQQGYLVYCGLLRTNVAALLRSAYVGRVETLVSAEFFANAADAYSVLRLIPESAYTIETADNSGRKREDCLRRLARVVCADLNEIGESGAIEIADQFVSAERTLIQSQVRNVSERHGISTILTAGIGSSLVATWINGIDLEEEIRAYADALPAFAVREVALRTG